MPWLVSMKWRAAFSNGDGTVSFNQPSDGIIYLDEHPACYIARQRMRIETLKTEPHNVRADDIDVVYCVIEVPPGTMSESEIEAMS